MNHHFILEFERVGGSRPDLDGQIELMADALHGDASVIDASIGADVVRGRIEFEVGAAGADVADALDVVWRAVAAAIDAAGGRVIGALHSHETAPAPMREPSDLWRQRRAELVDA